MMQLSTSLTQICNLLTKPRMMAWQLPQDHLSNKFPWNDMRWFGQLTLASRSSSTPATGVQAVNSTS